MFSESIYCQLGVAKGSRKVVPRTRTGYCEWSVAVFLHRCDFENPTWTEGIWAYGRILCNCEL